MVKLPSKKPLKNPKTYFGLFIKQCVSFRILYVLLVIVSLVVTAAVVWLLGYLTSTSAIEDLTTQLQDDTAELTTVTFDELLIRAAKINLRARQLYSLEFNYLNSTLINSTRIDFSQPSLERSICFYMYSSLYEENARFNSMNIILDNGSILGVESNPFNFDEWYFFYSAAPEYTFFQYRFFPNNRTFVLNNTIEDFIATQIIPTYEPAVTSKYADSLPALYFPLSEHAVLGIPVTSAATVYFDSNENLIGTINVVYFVESLQSKLQELSPSKNSFILLTEFSGEILALSLDESFDFRGRCNTSDPRVTTLCKEFGNKYTWSTNGPNIDEDNNSPIAQDDRIPDNSNRTEGFTFSLDLPEIGDTNVFHAIVDKGNIKYRMFIAMPWKDFSGQLKRNTWITLIVSISVLLVVLIIAIITICSFVRSLNRLGRSFGDIEHLKFKSRKVLRVIRGKSHIYEIAGLQQNFKAMVFALRSFSKYVPRDVVQQLVSNRSEARLGLNPRDCTVFFLDIKGFTSMTERIPPDKLVFVMSKLFNAFSHFISRNQGTIDKYIGDCIMAFWNAPSSVDKHEFLACKASLEIISYLSSVNDELNQGGFEPVHVRIGINTGSVLVGNFGSSERFNYTALGDAVNVASRLESVNEFYGSTIIISENTLHQCDSWVLARRLDTITVKGRKAPLLVYELMGLKDVELPEIRPYSQIPPGTGSPASSSHDFFFANSFSKSLSKSVIHTSAAEKPTKNIELETRVNIEEPENNENNDENENNGEEGKKEDSQKNKSEEDQHDDSNNSKNTIHNQENDNNNSNNQNSTQDHIHIISQLQKTLLKQLISSAENSSSTDSPSPTEITDDHNNHDREHNFSHRSSEKCTILRLACGLIGLCNLSLCSERSHFQSLADLLIHWSVEGSSRPAILSLCLFLLSVGHCGSICREPLRNAVTHIWTQNPEQYSTEKPVRETLLLMATYFHAKLYRNFADFIRSTTLLNIKIDRNNMKQMESFFTEDLVRVDMLAKEILTVNPSPQLVLAAKGRQQRSSHQVFALQCVYNMLRSDLFRKHRVDVSDWVWDLMTCCSDDPHDASSIPSMQIHSIISDIVEELVRNSLPDLDQNWGFNMSLLSKERILQVMEQRRTFTPRVLMLYYVLLVNKELRIVQSKQQSKKKLKYLPHYRIRPEDELELYGLDVLERCDVVLLVRQIQIMQGQNLNVIESPQKHNDASNDRYTHSSSHRNQSQGGLQKEDEDAAKVLYPKLIALVVEDFKHLFFLTTLLSDSISQPITIQQYPQTSLIRGLESREDILRHPLVNQAKTHAVMHGLLQMEPTAAYQYQETLIDVTLPQLLGTEAERYVLQDVEMLWDRFSVVNSMQISLETVNALHINQHQLTHEQIQSNVLILFGIDKRIFRCPPLFSIFLKILSLFSGASHRFVMSNAAVTADSRVLENNGSQERVAKTYIMTQDTTVIQLLFELCLAQDGGEEDLPELMMIRRQVCSFVHQRFIENPHLAKLVHFQTYSPQLLPVTVAGVDSIHICFDFLEELLSQPRPVQQVFGVQLTSYLSEKYPLPKTVSLARHALRVISFYASNASMRDHALDTLSAVGRIGRTFPDLAPDCIQLLDKVKHTFNDGTILNATAQIFQQLAAATLNKLSGSPM
eukprot:gb/GECH01010302.1/.p1 GENE.gb/GECH01010302.1/~~gb/GECH01010302.1/.p1  ORF type:complete len:1643 (+),score=394.33 gb/GECH01010302.1/:1-4929(+)